MDLENHEGMTNSSDTTCANVLVAMSADAVLFEDLFIGTINNVRRYASPLDFLVPIAIGSGLVIACIIIIVAMKRR